MATLGLGLAAAGRPGYMTLGHSTDLPDASVESMERNAHALLDRAYDSGVRHVDTARSYGKAEAFLSSWLARRQPTDLFISSKWGYRYTGGWHRVATTHEVKDLSVEHLRSQWLESRSLLGVNVSLYQIHSATVESGVFDDREVLRELIRLRDAGVAIGATVTGATQHETIRRIMNVNTATSMLFSWVQATWNLLERSAEPALEDAHASGIRIIVKEPLANGRLTARGDCAALLAHAKDAALSPDVLALGAALSRPWATTVLSGAATLPHLESNLHATRSHVSDELLAEVRPEPAAAYWQARSKLAWT